MSELANTAMRIFFRNMLVLVWVASLMLALPNSSYGQSPPTTHFSQELLDQYYRAAKRTVKLIISEFEPHLTPQDRRMLNGIDISISYSEDVNHVFAVRHSATGRRNIQISLGFIITMEAILDAFIIGDALGRIDDTLDYIEEVTRLMQENAVRRSRGYSPRVVPYFHQFAGISEREIFGVFSPEEFQSRRVLTKVDALAFVLAHELAHHFRMHLDVGNATYEDEKEADEFALDLGVKAGYSPLFGAWPYLFYISLEENLQKKILPRSHPAPTCRAMRFLDVGIGAALKDEGFVQYLDENNLKDEWMENVRVQQELVVDDCDQ